MNCFDSFSKSSSSCACLSLHFSLNLEHEFVNYWIIYNSIQPVVQLFPFHPEAQLHDPSVCWHVSGLQPGEHSREQFVPKYPSVQARSETDDEWRLWSNIKLSYPYMLDIKHAQTVYKRHERTMLRAKQIQVMLDVVMNFECDLISWWLPKAMLLLKLRVFFYSLRTGCKIHHN